MPDQLNNTLRELTRGEILRQLAQWYPRWMTWRSLLTLLDLSGYTTLEDDLAFHLAYLRDKGLVDLRIEDPGVGKPKSITTAIITSKGIDALDRRKEGDLGFR